MHESHLDERSDISQTGIGSNVIANQQRLVNEVNVLLIKAGGKSAGQWPINLGSERDWNFNAALNKHLNVRSMPSDFGKVSGGSSQRCGKGIPMRHNLSILAISLFAISAAGFTAQAQSSTELNGYRGRSTRDSARVITNMTTLNPFTHGTHIPASADLKSVRIQGIKRVRVATRLKSTLDPVNCENVSSDAGASGSLYCPEIELLDYQPAYQVTYTYQGPPLSSDEYGSKAFSFSVFFRPEELESLTSVSFLDNKRAAAESFRVIMSADSAERMIIDEKRSTFCPGHYSDAEWVYDNARCQDTVVLRLVTIPSDYVRVRVEVAP